MIRAKKSLGQHYLTDRNIARKIVSGLKAKGIKIVLEVGPGLGALTQFLVEESRFKTYFIEADRESVRYLIRNFPESEDEIIHADFLKFDIRKRFDEPVALIGNLPYNISGQIFFKILENRNIIREVVCMIQKEVADRIRSGPGTKAYGILSVLLKAYYNIEYLFTVSEKVFIPVPKVKSAVIRLVRNETEKLPCNEELFFRLVRAGFNQRRKTLRNSLKTILLNLELDHEFMKQRPEQLQVEQFIELTRVVEGKF
ncbi:MAG: 16S rRNA (adenine(1518)-N(6)/adenine(1519)-N(6))-dimethyltransferase RsmA [Bacteroidales bacterium]|nr:MAG: 16S rRNA (adenine(1518)-N(6)/adenine(1519)-N(6))-dimethyltransferase RsmA [Bacteroidales bacterium]